MEDLEEDKKPQRIVFHVTDATLSNACCIQYNELISGIESWWTQAYPVIEYIATVTGAITGVAAIATAPFVFVNWAHDKLRRKQELDEISWIKFVLNEDEWNPSILAQKLDLSELEAKKLLKGFGYIWDSKKMLYVSTDGTNKLRGIRT